MGRNIALPAMWAASLFTWNMTLHKYWHVPRGWQWWLNIQAVVCRWRDLCFLDENVPGFYGWNIDILWWGAIMTLSHFIKIDSTTHLGWQDMRCLLWIPCLIYVLSQSRQCYFAISYNFVRCPTFVIDMWYTISCYIRLHYNNTHHMHWLNTYRHLCGLPSTALRQTYLRFRRLRTSVRRWK